MGGHGGLNILPQKSWHLWTYKNRMKVQEDENKNKEKQKNLQHKIQVKQNERSFNTLRQKLQDSQQSLRQDQKPIESENQSQQDQRKIQERKSINLFEEEEKQFFNKLQNDQQNEQIKKIQQKSEKMMGNTLLQNKFSKQEQPWFYKDTFKTRNSYKLSSLGSYYQIYQTQAEEFQEKKKEEKELRNRSRSSRRRNSRVDDMLANDYRSLKGKK